MDPGGALGAALLVRLLSGESAAVLLRSGAGAVALMSGRDVASCSSGVKLLGVDTLAPSSERVSSSKSSSLDATGANVTTAPQQSQRLFSQTTNTTTATLSSFRFLSHTHTCRWHFHPRLAPRKTELAVPAPPALAPAAPLAGPLLAHRRHGPEAYG